MVQIRPFFSCFCSLDIIFKTAIIVNSFNRAIKAVNNMEKQLRNHVNKRF
jgi:hypothetical protein